MTKTFEDWRSTELEKLFGLQRVRQHPLLNQWLQTREQPPAADLERLSTLQHLLQDHAEYWNEAELREEFISPVVSLIGFTNSDFKAFRERPLAIKRKDIKGREVELKGRVEVVVATGKDEPEQPFFFIHEYKAERRKEREPLGQLLSAMLAAQTANEGDFPIYGCYVMGRFWFFVVLQGGEYSVSLAYDATQDDLKQIYGILTEVRKTIEYLVKNLKDT